MRFTFLSAALSALVFANAQSVGSTPGYNDGSISSTVAGNETLNFGSHFAILNLDFVNAIVSFVNSTDEGQQFLDCVKTWVDAANALPEKPLTIYTRVYFSNQFRPEIGPNAPFAETVAPLGNVTEEDAASEIYPAFEVQEDRGDVVLQKTRIYAGVNNGLELILRTQGIDTVILVTPLLIERLLRKTANMTLVWHSYVRVRPQYRVSPVRLGLQCVSRFHFFT